MENPLDLVQRYIAVWHEPDVVKRRTAIETIWTPDGRARAIYQFIIQ